MINGKDFNSVSDLIGQVLETLTNMSTEQSPLSMPKPVIKKVSQKPKVSEQSIEKKAKTPTAPTKAASISEDFVVDEDIQVKLFENPAEDILRGLIMAEILGKPRSLKKIIKRGIR